jgi:hypothetical protein
MHDFYLLRKIKMNYLLLILFCGAAVICVLISVVGVTQVQKYVPTSEKPVVFSNLPGKFGKACTTEMVECSTDQDCQTNCNEQQRGVDMACVALATPTDRTGTLPQRKTCAVRNAVMKCGKELGGVLTWSGWSNINRMQWDCLCQFPSYASNDNCTKLNAGVCSAYNSASKKFENKFNWTVQTGRPEWGTCTCPEGMTRQSTLSNQMPRCVPNSLTGLYTDLATADGYVYVGCVTLPAALSNTAVTVTGVKDALTKAAGRAFFALSETLFVGLDTTTSLNVSRSTVCQRGCTDNLDYKCAGVDNKNVRHWALYRKN